MAKEVFQGRLEEDLMAQIRTYCAVGAVTHTEAMTSMVKAFFAPVVQDHADQGMLIKALESEIEKLKLLTGKPRAMWPHSRKCAAVYSALACYRQKVRGGDCMISEFAEEMARAKEKYPADLWDTIHPSDMLYALHREVDELKTALWANDLNGLHGILREGMHVIVVATRIRAEMKRRLAHEVLT